VGEQLFALTSSSKYISFGWDIDLLYQTYIAGIMIPCVGGFVKNGTAWQESQEGEPWFAPTLGIIQFAVLSSAPVRADARTLIAIAHVSGVTIQIVEQHSEPHNIHLLSCAEWVATIYVYIV
jgi:hypothetical protein